MRSTTKTLITSERQQSLGEEIANSVSSGLCLLAIIAGIPFLFRSAVQRGDRLSLAGAIVFAASMVVLYLTSTVYHALPQSKVKDLFLRFDHSAIFLFIAGSYTPFTLGALRSNLGWTQEGLLWIVAGGLAYTTGVLFFVAKRVRYAHFIWHLFVAAGTACHFWAVLWYAG